jgi:hypothetical protein
MRHKIRPFQIVTSYGEMLGIDPRTIVPDEDAQKEADAEAQAQQTAMANEQAAKLAPAAAAAGAKPVAANSVLDQIMTKLGGAPGGPAGVAGIGA